MSACFQNISEKEVIFVILQFVKKSLLPKIHYEMILRK